MAYNRQPQTILAGSALKQSPLSNTTQPGGIIPVTLDVDTATTTSLGVVQVGSGLSITASGILSATGGSSSFINVTLTNTDYTATANDYYIGATKKDIDITLPLGIIGRVYIVKNQISGNIEVKGTGGQKIDTASSKTLGTDDSVTVVFDGTRWNVVE
jgi:hypothetical protein